MDFKGKKFSSGVICLSVAMVVICVAANLQTKAKDLDAKESLADIKAHNADALRLVKACNYDLNKYRCFRAQRDSAMDAGDVKKAVEFSDSVKVYKQRFAQKEAAVKELQKQLRVNVGKAR